MPLSPGTSIGPYEISGVLGAGGMGEVYRARDSRLKRDVAIKVLPASFADDPNRVTRLQREAEILASLNHPNIAHIYGLEEAGATRALVMELVEGPTLADRLVHGPIPLDEALPIAKQIAEALEAAHEQGVIHRDLKPANIKVRPDGTVKVLDFGLAKAMEPTTEGMPSVSHSPTITTPAMTAIGMILGTAAYMSPEQARGGRVEKRADVWAFGVILYEMLSGRRLFDEATVSDTLAAVLKGELKVDGLPRDTPAAVTRLIGRCLTRDWRRRLRDIGEARITIEDVLAHPETSGAPDTPAIAQQPLWRRSLPWAVALLALVTAALAIWAPWRAASARAGLTRLSTDFGGSIQTAAVGTVNVALSPNGQLLALIGTSRPGDRNRLFVRQLSQLEASPLPGTEGARNPFFSPDSQWIGFFADGKLKTIPVRGGAAIVVCDAPDDRGGSWTDDGWIVFTPTAGESPLVRVRPNGGTPERITTLTDGEITHRWPHVLPGGRAVIYTAHVSTGNYEQARIVVQSLDGGRRVVVHRGGYHAQYLPAGYLLYISQQKLFAAPFDASRFELTDQAVPLLSDVAFSQGTGAAQFAFSQTGALVYLPGAGNVSSEPINWIGRDGKSEPLRAAAAAYDTFRFSPDGERLAITIRDQQPDIWVYEWKREILNRVTSHDALDADPVWTPDGRRVAFRSARDGVDNLFWQRFDETGPPDRLASSKSPQWPTSWHPSGKFLAFRQIGAKTGQDIWILPMDGDEVSGWKPGTPYAYLTGPLNETEAVFSPDGRWLAYQSDESGRSEVYVRPFPGADRPSRVSTAGGLAPRWSRTGMELVFLSGDQKLMIAGYTVQGDVFRADKPRLWSDSAFAAFDLHPDGQRVAAIAAPHSPSASSSGKFVFVLNVEDELRRLASPDNR